MEIPIRPKYQRHTVKKMASLGGNAGHAKRTKISASAKALLKPQPRKVMVLDAVRGSARMVVDR